MSRVGNVYFAQAGPDGPVKIGVTSGPPMRRIAQLQSGNAETLNLIGVFFVDSEPAIEGHELQRAEAAFHHYLRADRIRGEWFSPSADMLSFIRETCDWTPDCG